jgi:hypothetical protein
LVGPRVGAERGRRSFEQQGHGVRKERMRHPEA